MMSKTKGTLKHYSVLINCIFHLLLLVKNTDLPWPYKKRTFIRYLLLTSSFVVTRFILAITNRLTIRTIWWIRTHFALPLVFIITTFAFWIKISSLLCSFHLIAAWNNKILLIFVILFLNNIIKNLIRIS